jgi:phospholipase/carboxylesterase
VQIAPDAELIQLDGWTLRIKKSTLQTPRLLLLLHGLTGDENSMWVFARDLPTSYEIIAPRAPYTAQPFGYSWRPMQNAELARPTREQLHPSAEAVIRLVDSYQASVKMEAGSERRHKFDVMGFSQGAAMSNMLAFLHPNRIRRVGILAGFIPSGLEEFASQRPLEGKPFFVAHGTRDDMVPIDRARASIEILEQAGAQVTYCEDEVGHKVSLPCLRALREFMTG